MQPNDPSPLVDRIPSRMSEKAERDADPEAPYESVALPVGIPNPSAIGAATAPHAHLAPANDQGVQETHRADMDVEKAALGLQPSSSGSTDSNALDEKAGNKPKKKGLFSRSKKDSTAVDATITDKPQIPPVPLFTLYRYHTKKEITMNLLGLVLAAAAGATQPLMTLIFGKFRPCESWSTQNTGANRDLVGSHI